MSSLLPFFATTALGLADNFANRQAAKKQNQRSEMYQTLMYNRQRSDALSDWHMQNAYNDPAAQMKRLQSAGLNPHLMYGQGTVGNSSTGVRSSDMPSPQYNVPKSNLGSVLQNALMIKQLQSNIARTDAETRAIEERTSGNAFDNEVNRAIGVQEKARRYDIETQRVSTQVARELQEFQAYLMAGYGTLDSGQMSAQSPAVKAIKAGFDTAVENYKNAKALGDKARAEAQISQFEAVMAKHGIPRNSPFWAKGMLSLYDKLGLRQFFDSLPATYQDLTK